MHRTKASPQLSIEAELQIADSALPTGYRDLAILGSSAPLVVGDNDGLIDGAVSYATRPASTCGTTQTTIEARIAHCAAQNPATAHWEGEQLGNAGQGGWTLVTDTGTYEVWRDDRTRLLWSDTIPAVNWCRAAGVSGGGPYGQVDSSGVCDNGANQDQVTPESVCSELPGLNTSAAYDARKGGMRLAATGTSPSIVWRLPTKWDFHLAETNGLRLIVALGYNWYWSSNFLSWAPASGWMYVDHLSNMAFTTRTTANLVRCVGRPGDGASTESLAEGYIDRMASGMLRDKTATQLTLRQELELGNAPLPSGYRVIPDLTKDHDGGSSVTLATRPTVVCGTNQNTIDARVENCATQNPASATWLGATNGHAAQGTWKLVTYNGTHEVWRDERTGLVWSDRLLADNWCRAAGNSGGGPAGEDDPDNFCDSGVNQDQTTPVSHCTEASGYTTSSTYDSAKGGMLRSATVTSPGVRWRLPTAWDFHLAEVNGIRHVVPNTAFNYWASTAISQTRALGWVHSHIDGGIGGQNRNVSLSVRCVGR